MALVLADRVRETSAVTSTGAATLLGAVTGYQDFSVIGNGNTTYYTIADQGGPNWEVGIGTWTTGGNLSRDTVLASSNSGSLVNFTSGLKDVFVTYPSEKSIYQIANGNVGIGTGAPAVKLAISGTDAVLVPKGTTAQQPTGVTGYIRYNTDNNQFEGYSGSPGAWNPVGGSILSNDTSTATAEYPLFASATSGSATTLYTSNANLLYTPSSGTFQSKTFVASSCFYMNPQTLPASYTVPASYSASSVGPITIPSGMSVTVSSGARWVVL